MRCKTVSAQPRDVNHKNSDLFLIYEIHLIFLPLEINDSSLCFIATPRFFLCNSVEFVSAALAQRVATNSRSPAPAPAPAPAQRLPFLLLGWKQEHHAGGHQDVPQRVRVEVVVLCLGKNIQAHPDQGTHRPGDEEQGPAFPRRWVAVPPPHPSIHLSAHKQRILINKSLGSSSLWDAAPLVLLARNSELVKWCVSILSVNPPERSLTLGSER